jgi:methionyl-tRNA synthetase
MSKKFYITTPIYYVNARPHIGHAYTTIACDTIARRQRLMGFDTYFLTGTDEHGQKIERAAQAAGKTPQQLTNEVSAEFRALWDRMGLTYDDFIRTTSDKHKQGVQALWRRIRDNGYIYKGSYTGQYCVFDELYVDVVGEGAPCPECGRPTETVKEENYFFKLSAFQDTSSVRKRDVMK